MAVSLATIRYVKALFSEAVSRGESGTLNEELMELATMFKSSPDLSGALRDPLIPPSVKKKVLADSGLDSASTLLQDFVGLCFDRNRPGVVLEAAEEYGRLERESRGVVIARVQTASQLTEEERVSLQARLEEATASSVEMKEETNPDLIGGLRVLIGSRMFDGSVKRQLDDLTSDLLSARLDVSGSTE